VKVVFWWLSNVFPCSHFFLILCASHLMIFMFCFSIFHTLAHSTLSYLVVFHSDITIFTYLSNSLLSKFIIPPKSNLYSYWLSYAVLCIWNLVSCDTWHHDSVPKSFLKAFTICVVFHKSMPVILRYCLPICVPIFPLYVQILT
jgi:hypothetical protein